MSQRDPWYDQAETPPSPEWDLPPTAATDPARSAATLLWLTAAATVVVFGTCALGMLGIAAIDLDRLLEQTGPAPLPPDQEEILREFQGIAVPQAIGFALVFVLPAIALVVAGFGVRAGRRRPTRAARIVIGVHAVAVGLLLTLSLVEGMRQGNPVAVFVAAVFLGGLLALQIGAWRSLSRLLHRPEPAIDDPEPWNRGL